MWSILAAAIAVWFMWSIVFIAMTRTRDPQSIGMTLHRWLIAGSLAELLIAVPTHIVVRRRQECCAGLFISGFAIAIGAGVMIIAFGPSALFALSQKMETDFKSLMQPQNDPSSPPAAEQAQVFPALRLRPGEGEGGAVFP